MPYRFLAALRDPGPLVLEAVLSFDQRSTATGKPSTQISRVEKRLEMLVPILLTVRHETVLAIHEEVLSSTNPGRDEGHADGHVLDLLEATLAVIEAVRHLVITTPRAPKKTADLRMEPTLPGS